MGWSGPIPKGATIYGEKAVAEPARTLAKCMDPLTRHTPGSMNKLEQAYSRVLDLQKAAKEIHEWRFEGITLIIAEPVSMQRLRLTMDFMVIRGDMTIELADVKGFMEDDALAKLKVASSVYPWFQFVIVSRHKGEWIRKEV